MSDAPERERRDHLARIAIAAWVNVDPAELPESMNYHTCAHTREAWARVATAMVAAGAPAWQDIATAPKDGTAVDLWAHGMRWTNMEWCSSSPLFPYGAWQREGSGWENGIDLSPTHWMPLPPAPQQEKS